MTNDDIYYIKHWVFFYLRQLRRRRLADLLFLPSRWAGSAGWKESVKTSSFWLRSQLVQLVLEGRAARWRSAATTAIMPLTLCASLPRSKVGWRVRPISCLRSSSACAPIAVATRLCLTSPTLPKSRPLTKRLWTLHLTVQTPWPLRNRDRGSAKILLVLSAFCWWLFS